MSVPSDRTRAIEVAMTLQGGGVMPDQPTDLQRAEHQLIFQSQLSNLPIIANPAGLWS